jgi:hypothetical protein
LSIGFCFKPQFSILYQITTGKERRTGKMKKNIGRQAGISARALASLILFCAGAWLVPSGIALHFASHGGVTRLSHIFMSIHNTASLLFVSAALVHVTLNWKALTSHMRTRAGEYMRFKRELLIAVLGVSGFVLLVASHALHIP